jgi:hypothetical protein
MALSFLFGLLRRVIEGLRVHWSDSAAKDAEILVLRHQCPWPVLLSPRFWPPEVLTPLERGAPRPVSDLPGAPVDGVQTRSHVYVISSQTGDPGAPEITKDQPFGGGPSRKLNNIIGGLGQAAPPWMPSPTLGGRVARSQDRGSWTLFGWIAR